MAKHGHVRDNPNISQGIKFKFLDDQAVSPGCATPVDAAETVTRRVVPHAGGIGCDVMGAPPQCITTRQYSNRQSKTVNINGQWVDPIAKDREMTAIHDPATEAWLADVVCGGADDVDRAVAAARAAFTALRRSIGTQRLEREASLAALSAELTRAGRSVERREALFARGEISEAELTAATDAVYAIEQQLHVQEEMLALLNETGDEQVLLEKNRLVALAAVLHRENERLSALHVEASDSGLVEEVSAAVGDWVSPGTELIRLIRPEQLQAELKVPLPGATRIRSGDAVLLVDAVGDTTDGKVRVVGETLPMKGDKYARVSVQLSKPPRTDAAVDAGVDAIINIGLLDNALFVKRPAWAADDGVASIFRVDPDGKTAERVKVKFGTGSWDRIQVLDGLEEGDVIIVSDMSRFDDVDCVRLEP